MDNILKLFIENPEQEFHIRKIAKLVSKSPMTIAKYLRIYEKEGLLTFEERHNFNFYKANSSDNKFKDLKREYNIGQLRKSGLIDYLLEEYNHPEAIILFGSYAKSENISKSDIDLFIVSPNEKEINLSKFEKKLKHSIQLFVMSKSKLKNMKNKNLLNNLINGIVLDGYLELFN